MIFDTHCHLDENYFPILWREDGYRTPDLVGDEDGTRQVGCRAMGDLVLERLGAA